MSKWHRQHGPKYDIRFAVDFLHKEPWSVVQSGGTHRTREASYREALVGCNSRPALTFLATTGAKEIVGAVLFKDLSSIVVVCSTDGGSPLKPGHPVPAIVANHRFNGTINLYSCCAPIHPRKPLALSSWVCIRVAHGCREKKGAKSGQGRGAIRAFVTRWCEHFGIRIIDSCTVFLAQHCRRIIRRNELKSYEY